MEIKFKKSLYSYDYLIMFDLASRITGVCIWDLKNKRPVETDIIKVKGEYENNSIELNQLLKHFFTKISLGYGGRQRVLIAKEQGLLNAGKFSTIQTITGLAKAHAVLDVFCYEYGYDCYDYDGVAPATTHAYYKKLRGLESKEVITKDDIRDYLLNTYDLKKDITLDETDAVFLAKTLVESKWNKDIQEKIKEIKRHIKELKSQNAIKIHQEEINRLTSLML